MPNHLDLLPTLTGGLAAALVLGYITQRLKLSPIVGYLLAGVVVGPHTPGFHANHELAEQLAELGVILLMFGVGLHFHLKELLAVRRIAIPGAIFQSLVATVLGAVVARVFGWDWTAGVVFGLAISVASTVVLIRVLSDNHDLHTPTGHIAVGWLVVEDLFTVVVLVLLPAFAGGVSPETAGVSLPMTVGMAIFKIGVLVASVFVLGSRIIPWLLTKTAATHSRELFTLTILVTALGIAVGSSYVFGVSMALGAFLAGMVVGRSDFSLRATAEALPMRDAFAVLFFVSVGMLLNPYKLWESPGFVIATLAVVMIGKPAAALAIVAIMGYPLRTAIAVAVALAQIGEFSFILAALGTQLKILPEEATNALVASAILSISINPLLYRLVDPLNAFLQRSVWLRKWLAARSRRQSGEHSPAAEERLVDAHRTIIVGYGPVGKTLSRLLRDAEIEPVIVEMNLETVRRLRREGTIAVYGDAGHRETLESAGVTKADSLILTASSLPHSREIIRLARELNPEIRVIVRTAYLRETDALRRDGADVIVSGESEVALAMTECILRDLGALPEQIDRERERVRADLFDMPQPTTMPVAVSSFESPEVNVSSPEAPLETRPS